MDAVVNTKENSVNVKGPRLLKLLPEDTRTSCDDLWTSWNGSWTLDRFLHGVRDLPGLTRYTRPRPAASDSLADQALVKHKAEGRRKGPKGLCTVFVR